MYLMGLEVKECGTGFKVKTLQSEATAGLPREFLSRFLAAKVQAIGVRHPVAQGGRDKP